MHIVTDSGMDMYLPENEKPGVAIHVVRHSITLSGKTYFSGLDLQAEELYAILKDTGAFPTTSQPCPLRFLFRKQ